MTTANTPSNQPHEINLVACIPFIAWHAMLPLAFLIPFKWEYVAVAVGAYFVRMFAITAGYHRYFAHRAFKTNRVFQFILAFLAQTSAQKGALWWAANHRHHHRYSDQEEDIHSPARKGFFWSHIGWILVKKYEPTNYSAIKDFAKYPELVWLNEHFMVPPMVALAVTYAIGGLPWAFWAGVVSTVALWHGTFTINSLTHIFGSRRYVTTDTSRNNFFFALLTMGEGWHNNHHFHQNTANQGWFWWEIDATFYILKALAWLGVVSDLRLPSEQTKYCYLKYTDAQRAQLSAETKFNAWRTPPPPKTAPTPEATPVITLGAAPQPGQA
ncbi:MAG: acyl-CoA desaturase [Myxococcaceae bacterium]|nr:acyl-CoA desaturase [Myxococcaceae bacterium]